MPLSRWSGRLKHCHLLDENGYLPASILKQAADHKIGRAPAPTFAGHSEREEKSTSEARPPAGLGRTPGPPPPASPSQGRGSKGLLSLKKQPTQKQKPGSKRPRGCGMQSNFPARLGTPRARARSGAVGWGQAARHRVPRRHSGFPGFVSLNITRPDRANSSSVSGTSPTLQIKAKVFFF